MKFVFYSCVVLALVASLVSARLHLVEWDAYKEQHGKVYEDSSEDLQRYANYLATKQLIQEHNSQQSTTFRLELNHMADWSMDEFTAPSENINRVKVIERNSPHLAHLNFSFELPAEFDWRKDQDYQVVSEVGDQGKCASSWAFGTTGVLEGQQSMTTMPRFKPLSVQQLLDCSRANNGCQGGLVSVGLCDLSDEGGIESDSVYPYTGTQNKYCKFESTKMAMRVAGMKVMEHLDEIRLARYIFHYGPIAIEIDATEKLKSYKSGVFDDPTCQKKKPNHSALIVGYGTDHEDGDFWIVKNSWSTKWGEQGYFRLRRGTNACGVQLWPTIPLFL